MRYLVIQPAEGMEFPVFCVAPKTHEDLATAWRRDGGSRIVSAGFVEFLPDGRVRTYSRSTALNLAPRPQDARLIAIFYKATLGAGQVQEAGAPAAVVATA